MCSPQALNGPQRRRPEDSDVLLSWPKECKHSTEDIGLQDNLLPLGVGGGEVESGVKERVEVGGGLGS